MTKDINTLVDDIYDLFRTEKFNPTPEAVADFGQRLATHIADRIAEEHGKPALRISMLGTKCDRKIWYMINHPEWAEGLSAETRIKFLFGDILESLLLFFAEQAGHKVEGSQDVVDLFGVKGHRDAVIDGRLVDVKSASTQAFRKFKDNNVIGENDSFGYQEQLNGYYQASLDDPTITDKDNISFLAIDKQFGHIALDTYSPSDINFEEKIEHLRTVISMLEPPARSFGSVPEGKSGNEKLGVYCSYCGYKGSCWETLKGYSYSKGPVFLTKVVREPDVPRIF